jgi:hypothetical protein
MSTTMSDVRTVPAVEPRPIIPSLAAFYSHARDLSWVVVRLTAGGMLLVHGIMKVMPMVEKGVVPTIEAFATGAWPDAESSRRWPRLTRCSFWKHSAL